MAEQALDQPAPTDETPAKKSKSGLFALVKVVAFVSVIVVVELVVASALTPSAADTERLGHELAAANHGRMTPAAEQDDSTEHGGESLDVREVNLGTFNITRFNPATNMTRVVDFELFGTVLAKDLPEFEHLFENSQARVREQVIMILHGAESTDLTDAGLGLLKRRILEKTNRVLGHSLIREVLFSKFNFVER